MPYKDPKVRKAKAREYAARYYLNNRAESIKRNAANKERHKQLWREFKAGLSCVACGLSGQAGMAALLDFHHLPEYRASEVKASVNRLLAHGRFTRARRETQHCVVLCSNCHRLGHVWERQGWPQPLEGLAAVLRAYFLDKHEYEALIAAKGG